MKSLFASLACACAPGFATPVDAVRAAAGPDCSAIAPFYWEIGDAHGVLASGSVKGRATSGPTRNTRFAIASASKWAYGAYVLQLRGGALTAQDVNFLHLTSGYSGRINCADQESVADCAANLRYSRRNDGLFDYSGAHMQVHATVATPLGPDRDSDLAAAINGLLGTDFTYTSPQLAGGIEASTATFAVFLQRVMTQNLVMGAHLSDEPVCTLPGTCATALTSPLPEAWHYGIGHWIEDAPGNDGAFSSPGAFGFYPWISADLSLYGVVARHYPMAAWSSVVCGREIRNAFVQP